MAAKKLQDLLGQDFAAEKCRQTIDTSGEPPSPFNLFCKPSATIHRSSSSRFLFRRD